MTMTLTSSRISRSSLRGAIRKTAVLSGLIAALLAAPAFADEAAEVGKLMHAGQNAAALAKADAFLAKNPRDAQMRFLKGVILTEQNKSADAIAIFSKLTEDYPTLPEPYNNLAVLYAAAGNYDKARAALDAAIRTNPSYATAYENLGDVHAKLASQAYDKALQLDSHNSTAKSKLTLVRSLVGNMKEMPAAPAVPPLAAKTPAPAPTPTPAGTPAPAPAPVAPAPASPAPAVKQPAAAAPAPKPMPAEAPVAAAKPEKAVKPAPEKAEAPVAPAKPVQKAAAGDDVMNAVQDWAKAWSARDVKAYLDHYSRDFDTPRGMSRKVWEDQRRARIVDKKRISVRIESPQVKVSGNTATVSFHQVYESDRLDANSRKTLVLEKRDGVWLIKQENTSS